ncbi:hypothetical protein [Draconibacterium orientale]|uniref:hypothetical protein n=1 Tax=Draconibacterium orientale TaxID=1168034 RepID=UPI0029C01DC8|nr:hypothetical protein [Draconibacterium orientale]
MRKIILSLLIVIPIISFAQEKVIWDYPVKPGSEEWKAIDNTYQKIEICQIPQEILNTISTESLVSICLNYPLFTSLFFSNHIQPSFNRMIKQFNGFNELITRKDAGSVLLSVYKKLEPRNLEDKWEQKKRGFFTFEFIKVELFLANDNVLANMTKTELLELTNRCKYIYREKEKKIDDFGYNFGLAPTTLILGKIAIINDNSVYKDDKQKDKFKYFMKTGTIYDKALLENIYENTNN